ncbi:hypothetical protein [Lysobacter sp. N42]|uniref:hypothetical protein n=1 Tax=Lysobacter sp. N42 TaxID=2545719 RepID=UPI00104C36F8|nr:hypothetical protein [Lysobacter sp. N42]TCZ87621.1 hypothetical protein EYQ95_16310 [Lysobacter sp. N42]
MIRLSRRLQGLLARILPLWRPVTVQGRVAWPGACADRASGEAHWTVRVTLLDACIGRARLGEPLELHWRCAPEQLHALLVALSPDATLTARIRLDRGARMRARLCGIDRVQPPPRAVDQKNARTPKEMPRPGSGA